MCRPSIFLRSIFSFAVLLALFSVSLSACTGERGAEEKEETPETTDGSEAVRSDTAGNISDVGAADVAQLGIAQQEPYGKFLADAEGRALYLFTADTQGESSACYDACAEAWPPLLTTGEPTAVAPAVDTSMIGTIERRDGVRQVTYNGWPLYYYSKDEGAGKATGQDIHSFGGEWYLVSPQGTQIEAESQ